MITLTATEHRCVQDRPDILSVFHRRADLAVRLLSHCYYEQYCSMSGLLFCTRRPRDERLSYNHMSQQQLRCC